MPLRTFAVLLACTGTLFSADAVEDLRQIDVTVVPGEQREAVASQVRRQVERDLMRANAASTREWEQIRNREAWETFRKEKLERLRSSLGTWPELGTAVTVHRSGTIAGDGYAIDNLIFESRPGLWVTANLYRPDPPRASQPGIVLCHSHHTPKTHPELQDMGTTWARAGCCVLVLDQLGHGERRQHSFSSAADFAKPYRVGHADYYFRYDSGIQLQLVGESLAGWMAGDLMRGVDVLLAQPGIDPQRVLLLGAVAGGGDPAAIAGALDERFAAVVPFNFGGPQPETRYPLPDNAQETFDYAGGGSWESTRNLRRSAADGTLPWVIVGSIAPRGLIYAHEFRWDRERDPVWARLQALFHFYGQRDRLAFTLGDGSVAGSSATDTHCTHIGRRHPILIDEAFRQWFQIDVSRVEPQPARPAADLQCWTEELRAQLQPQPLNVVLQRHADQMVQSRQDEWSSLSPDGRREAVRARWAPLLGTVEPSDKLIVRDLGTELVGDVLVRRVVLTVEEDVAVPLVLACRIRIPRGGPLVVGICSQGKSKLWDARAADLRKLLNQNASVCLVDPRGLGESRLGDSHGRRSSATSISSSRLMLGAPLLGDQVRDVRTVLAWLRTQDDLASRKLVLWGESLVPANSPDAAFRQPRDSDDALPPVSRPGGPLVALLTALVEDNVTAVYTAGGLASWRSLLAQPLVLTSYDSLIPGVFAAGDMPDVTRSLAPARVRLEASVDGWNRLAEPAADTANVSHSASRTSVAEWIQEATR